MALNPARELGVSFAAPNPPRKVEGPALGMARHVLAAELEVLVLVVGGSVRLLEHDLEAHLLVHVPLAHAALGRLELLPVRRDEVRLANARGRDEHSCDA